MKTKLNLVTHGQPFVYKRVKYTLDPLGRNGGGFLAVITEDGRKDRIRGVEEVDVQEDSSDDDSFSVAVNPGQTAEEFTLSNTTAFRPVETEEDTPVSIEESSMEGDEPLDADDVARYAEDAFDYEGDISVTYEDDDQDEE